ncbi:DUF4386 domain-containing protein [Halobacteriota archaeon]
MDSNQKIARIVGILFIIGTVAGILSVVIAGSIIGAPDYLIKVSANENQIIIGAIFVLIMGFALAMIPAVVFPIFKKHNEALAYGYVIFRGAFETITYIAVVISWLILITLSQEFVQAGAPVASHFQTSGTLLLGAIDSIDHISTIVFSLGALMFYYFLYQSKLIPRWLAGWGLIGATLVLAVGLLGMFGLVLMILWAPLAVQEMALAVWLIVKGFNPSAIEPESA